MDTVKNYALKFLRESAEPKCEGVAASYYKEGLGYTSFLAKDKNAAIARIKEVGLDLQNGDSFDIHAGSNTSEVDGLIAWGGTRGYWYHVATDADTKDGRRKQVLAKEVKDIKSLHEAEDDFDVDEDYMAYIGQGVDWLECSPKPELAKDREFVKQMTYNYINDFVGIIEDDELFDRSFDAAYADDSNEEDMQMDAGSMDMSSDAGMDVPAEPVMESKEYTFHLNCPATIVVNADSVDYAKEIVSGLGEVELGLEDEVEFADGDVRLRAITFDPNQVRYADADEFDPEQV